MKTHSPNPRRPRRAAATDPGLRAANLRQLRRIEGQVRGVLRMIEDDRYCADIVTQIAAIRQSLAAVSRNLFRNHLAHCARAAIEAGRTEAVVEELTDLFSRAAR